MSSRGTDLRVGKETKACTRNKLLVEYLGTEGKLTFAEVPGYDRNVRRFKVHMNEAPATPALAHLTARKAVEAAKIKVIKPS